MKVRAWTCGLMAVMMGCNTVDRTYDPPAGRTNLLGDRAPVPPGAQPTWQQQQNRTSALAFRGPGGDPVGPYGATGGPLPLNPAAAQGGFFGNQGGVQSAGFNPGMNQGTNLAANGATAPITQVAYEGDSPIRVVPPGGLQGGSSTDKALSALTQPLSAPPVGDRGETDVGMRRRVMNPTQPASLTPGAEAACPPTGMPPLQTTPILMAKEPAHGGTPPAHEETAPTAPLTPATAASTSTSSSPAVRMVNTRRVVLNYEVKDVGPSGVSAVDLWVTRDGGHSWKKDDSAVRSGPPLVTEVPEEGTYGFTLVARSGLGLGKQPPVSGDPPQVWVEVDLTKPVVSLVDVKHGIGAKAREVTITWAATDRNLARRPVTLAYAEKAEGPWMPLAANIDNSGSYVWNMPQNAPTSFHIRVEAVDLVGNVGFAQSVKPIVIDLSQPTTHILGVEPGEK